MRITPKRLRAGELPRAAAISAVLATGIACTPLAQADGNQASLEQAVRQVYEQVQRACTPRTPPQFQRIVWNNVSGGGGVGRIVDANASLGGPFQAWWDNTDQAPPAGYRKVPAQPQGYWDIELQFC